MTRGFGGFIALRSGSALISGRVGSKTMCYAVYLSTDSPADLSARTTDLVRLERLSGKEEDPVVGLLGFTNRWYVGSKSGCSCMFRHLVSTELGFGEPEEWYPEDQVTLVATKNLYEVISTLLSAGHAVDCLDRWEGAEPSDIHTLVVSLHEVSSEAFRLFENHRFTFTKGIPQPPQPPQIWAEPVGP